MFVATCSSKQPVAQSASGMWRTTAALLTSPSIRPYRARQASVIRRGLSGSARSAGTHSASPPAAVISAATSFSGPSRRPARTTGAPTEPSWRAVAAPIPLPPPVTITTAPRSPASVSTGGVAGPRPSCIATLPALPAPCSYVKHMSICSRVGLLTFERLLVEVTHRCLADTEALREVALAQLLAGGQLARDDQLADKGRHHVGLADVSSSAFPGDRPDHRNRSHVAPPASVVSVLAGRPIRPWPAPGRGSAAAP